MRIILILLSFLSGCRPIVSNRQQVLEYEPVPVTLTGVIWTADFPGPPNYEDIKKGDVAEHHSFLRLRNPVTVKGNPNELANSETETNITDISIQMNSKTEQALLELSKSKTVVVSGTLFHAQTGHHRSLVLMDGTTINLLSNALMKETNDANNGMHRTADRGR